MSGQKKELYLKKEQMQQAKIRLKKKCETQLQREKNRLHQQKCRLLKLVPESPSKFKHAFKAMCKLANASPHKQEIINDCLGHFNFASKSIPQKKLKLSVIQLQMLRRQNRVTEHKQMIEKIKSEYGSIRKASGHLHVPYKTLQNLCQPLVKRKKNIRETWVNIRNFYEKEIVSHEHPSVQLKGRRFLTTTIEQCYSLYKEDCRNESKTAVAFSTFACLRPKNVFKIKQTPDRQCICDECKNF